MRDWSPEAVARAAGVRLADAAPTGPDAPTGPLGVTIDSRAVRPGDLFVGLPGANVDGGSFARAALDAGASILVIGRPITEADDPDQAARAIEATL